MGTDCAELRLLFSCYAALGVGVSTILSCALDPEFAIDFRVQIEALVSIGTCREVFATFSRMHKRTIILI